VEGLTAEQARAERARLAPEGLPALERTVRRGRAALDGIEERHQRLAAVPAGVRRVALALVLLGAIFHLVNHAGFKSLLFLCAGAIERATGTRNLKELGGLWQRMPVTSATCAVGALSISGVPPFNGFWSKLMIIAGAGLAGHWALAVVTVAVSFLTLVSFVKVQKYALFGPMSARVLRGTREVAPSMCFSMVALAAACLLLGVLAVWVVPEVIGPAAGVLRGGARWWDTLLAPLSSVN
jgi:multicomponent Na+:H+ antiporter subunit D